MPELHVAAADGFDARHDAHTLRVEGVAAAAKASHKAHRRKQAAFERSMWELRWNRYVVDERLQEKKQMFKRTQVAQKVWRLDTSIWAPRRKYCDARDFYDNEAVCARMFERDWQLALAAHRLDNFITRHDDDGEATELDEVRVP